MFICAIFVVQILIMISQYRPYRPLNFFFNHHEFTFWAPILSFIYSYIMRAKVYRNSECNSLRIATICLGIKDPIHNAILNFNASRFTRKSILTKKFNISIL